jgi:oxygen-dependent protoporphyrinogen oxidase
MKGTFKAANSQKRVAIIGGGVTGLAAAYELSKTTDAEIDLYEADARLGGKVGTSYIQGFTVEGGPDCFFAAKPGVMDFIRELDLESELIAPLQKEFFMLAGGELHRVPGGLVRLTSPSSDAIREATFLSPEAKDAALHPRTPEPKKDESIRSFFSSRYGAEFSRLVAEPLLAGTHGGDPEKLSMRSLYPNYLQPAQTASASAGPTFLSFRRGMQTLVDALVGRLGRTRVHFQSHVRLSELEADQILVALPANSAALLLQEAAPEATRWLGNIPHASSAIVTLAYPSDGICHDLDGTGFLVPSGESESITGSTWSSRKWANRAPEGSTLIRVFLGGHRGKFTISRNGTLIKRATDAIQAPMKVRAEPTFAQVTRWIDALPQYELGHVERLAAIDEAMRQLPHIHLAGTSFRGVGVPDCLRQGREAAKKIAEAL